MVPPGAAELEVTKKRLKRHRVAALQASNLAAARARTLGFQVVRHLLLDDCGLVLSRKLFANVSSLFANGDRQSAMPLLDARKLQAAAKEEITKVPKHFGNPLPDQVRSRNFVAAVAAGNFDAQG
jgi:hypothetical protein